MSLDANRQAQPIVLIPIGRVAGAILTVIGEGLREAFGRACVLSAPLPMQSDKVRDLLEW